MSGVREIEGTWEQVAAHGPELAGKRVHLRVLDNEEAAPNGANGNGSGPHDDAGAIVIPPRPAPTPEQAALGILPAVGGVKPVTDVDAWLASLPHFDGTDEEFAAFEQAIAENRATQRKWAQEKQN